MPSKYPHGCHVDLEKQLIVLQVLDNIRRKDVQPPKDGEMR